MPRLHLRRTLVPCLVAVLALLAAPAAAQQSPAFSKSFSPDIIGVGGTATLTFVIDNGNGSTPVSGLAFTDVLPAGLTLADPAFARTDCGSGTVEAADGGDTVSLADGVVDAFSICRVEVDVTATAVGEHVNLSGDLTSSAGDSGPASAALTVALDRPGFRKVFDPPVVRLGGTSTLTFTIDNSAGGDQALALVFSDTLPAGLEIAAPPLLVNTCGGTATAPAGGSTIDLLFGSVTAGSTCTVSVAVTAAGGGPLHNRSSDLTGVTLTDSGILNANSGHADATLDVTVDPLALVKEVLGNPVPPGGTATLRFTLLNFSRDDAATAIAFSDDLAEVFTGLAAVPPLPAEPCGAGSTLTGGSEIVLAGGSLPPAGSCSFEVTVAVPADAEPGVYTNATSEVTAELGGVPIVSSPASDQLEVAAIPLLGKEFTDDPVGAGSEVTLEFTVTNSSPTAAATDIEFDDELTTFLPAPLQVTLPSEPCGAGSSLSLIALGTDEQAIRLSDGNLAPGASCTFAVVVTIPAGFPGGTYLNTTSPVTAVVGDEIVTGPPASDELVVHGAPRLRKEVVDDPAQPGGTATLEFTVSHDENAAGDAVDIAFSDDLGGALAGLAAVGLPLADPCGPGSALSGTAVLALTGGRLAPGETCTFQVTLQVPSGATPGAHENITSALTATVAGQPTVSNPARDELLIAGLELDKELVDDPALPGGTVTLRFTVANLTAASTFTGITFQDDLAAVVDGLTALGLPLAAPCGAGSQLVGSAGDTLLTLAGGALGPGASCTFDVVLQVPPDTPSSTYPNTTSGFQGVLDGGPAIPFPNASDFLVVDARRVELAKEFLDDPVRPGDTVTLRFTLTNLGDDPVGDLAFTDDLAAALPGLAATGGALADPCGAGSELSGTEVLSFTGGSLAGGGSCSFDVVLQVPSAIAPGAVGLNVTSAVSGAIGGLAVTGGPASDTLEIATVAFGKAFSGPATPGGTVTLVFTIENDGSAPLAGLRFNDVLGATTLPGLAAVDTPLAAPCGAGSTLTGGEVLVLDGGALASGASCSFAVTLAVPSDAAAGAHPNVTSALTAAGVEIAPPAAAELVVQPPAGPPALEIPAAGTWELLLLAALLAAGGLWRLRG